MNCDVKKPTEKQLLYIEDIEEYLHVSFNGETKEDAREFLSKYAPIYQEMVQLDFEMNNDTSNAMDRL